MAKYPEPIGESEAVKRTEALDKAQQERFEKVADKVLKVFGESDTTLAEYPLIVAIVSKKINSKIDGGLIGKLLSL